MRSLLLAIAATIIASASASAQTEDQCAYDVGAMMNLDYEAFDRTPDQGWRAIGNTPACEAAAADLLARYRTERIDDQRRGLMHHEAQMRAAAGQTDAAIALISQVRAGETQPWMIAYRDAEIAFLGGDLPALTAARDRLLAIPPPPGFEEGAARFRERYPTMTPPTWPLNIDVVNGLIACFGRPYSEAYACRANGN